MQNNAEYKLVGEGTAVLTGENLPFALNIIVGNADKKDITNATMKLTQTTFTETGKSIQPLVSVKYEDTELVMDTDFIVSCENNVKIGTATITVTGAGDYTGSINKTYKIVPVCGEMKSIKKSGTTYIISWNEASDADGYEIYYAKAKYGKYKKLENILGKTECSSTKLKAGYYIKIRSYKTVDGEKYYSDYSNKEKIL